jgi:ferrous iron transport protein A
MATPQTYPLSLSQLGKQVQVSAIKGGNNLMKRLLAMGITEGSALTVIQHGEGLVVRCQDTRWALGHGMAHKILVTDMQG